MKLDHVYYKVKKEEREKEKLFCKAYADKTPVYQNNNFFTKKEKEREL